MLSCWEAKVGQVWTKNFSSTEQMNITLTLKSFGSIYHLPNTQGIHQLWPTHFQLPPTSTWSTFIFTFLSKLQHRTSNLQFLIHKSKPHMVLRVTDVKTQCTVSSLSASHTTSYCNPVWSADPVTTSLKEYGLSQVFPSITSNTQICSYPCLVYLFSPPAILLSKTDLPTFFGYALSSSQHRVLCPLWSMGSAYWVDHWLIASLWLTFPSVNSYLH